MSLCLLIQPIHRAGIARLRDAGLEVQQASQPDMATVAAEIGEAAAVITRNAGLDRAAMDAAPRLRVVGVHGIGADPVAVDHAAELGIPVVFTPDGNVASVAEQAIALLLALAKQVPAADRAVRAGDFGFKYRAPLGELQGKVFGVVGFGRIGRRTAMIAHHGLGMDILVHSRSTPRAEIESLGYSSAADLETLLTRSDVVSLHLVLTPETRGLIGATELGLMKPTAFLINTGRGATLDEAALIDALQAGRIAGAGLDVFKSEHMTADYPLLELDNVILSPHVAGSTAECMERIALSVADQVLDVLAGRRPHHLVNPEAWPKRRRQ